MSKLARIKQNVFGSGAGARQISVFGSLFAGSPATTTSPATAQSLSNWLTGWLGAAIGGNAPAIEDMNAVHFVSTYQLAYLLQSGIPEWDSTTPYYTGSFASDGLGGIYSSLTDANTGNVLTETTKWKMYNTDATGTGKDFWGSVLPGGYVWASGKTIGNPSSNATERANFDTLDLFTLLWENYDNSILPIYTSAGAASTRGASALIDYNANKALAVIDKRGRISAGLDNIGGTSSSRLSTLTPNGNTLGASGGAQTHQLTSTEMPSHTHTQNPHTHSLGYSTQNLAGGGLGSLVQTGSSSVNATTATNNNTGGDGSHNNVQPTIACNYILKL